MSAAETCSVINSWETVRYELLNTRVADLGLRIKGSPLEPLVQRLYREFDAKGLTYKPEAYLTDSWGCPDEVPAIGIPFYLADRRLARIEEEQTGEIEDDQMIMMLLRHEAGHAVNYAYRLWERSDWAEVFGHFARAYRDTFQPDPFSRQFVRHLTHSQYRWMYAQKHPDEDFAETFAVWITPRAGWRTKYRNWPALKKLDYVSTLLRHIRREPPVCVTGTLLNPADTMNTRLADHYGQRTERYRAAAQGYVDDKLHRVFPPVRGHAAGRAATLIGRRRRDLRSRVTRWSGLDTEDAGMILGKLHDRATALALEYRLDQEEEKVLDLTALTTALAMDFGYTGRFAG